MLIPNTFGIRHTCRALYEPPATEALTALLPQLRDEPLLVVGAGSNLLLTRDFAGNVLHPAMRGIVQDGTLLRCGAGETWDDVVAYAVEHQLYGIENLSLIPGEVGASAVQNIGAYGAEACDVIERIYAIEVATGAAIAIDPADCQYGYRHSRFKDEWRGRYIITAVDYRLSDTFTPHLDYGNLRAVLAEQGIDTPTAAHVRQAVIAIRRQKLPDPEVEGNAGSFFMNPVVPRSQYEDIRRRYPAAPHYDLPADQVKIPAAWLIEQCGWKGRSLGRAGVHERQPLVLVNRGGATGAEVVALCKAVQSDVKQQFGIDIKPEVNII